MSTAAHSARRTSSHPETDRVPGSNPTRVQHSNILPSYLSTLSEVQSIQVSRTHVRRLLSFCVSHLDLAPRTSRLYLAPRDRISHLSSRSSHLDRTSRLYLAPRDCISHLSSRSSHLDRTSHLEIAPHLGIAHLPIRDRDHALGFSLPLYTRSGPWVATAPSD